MYEAETASWDYNDTVAYKEGSILFDFGRNI
jgi:hypothetical protein